MENIIKLEILSSDRTDTCKNIIINTNATKTTIMSAYFWQITSIYRSLKLQTMSFRTIMYQKWSYITVEKYIYTACIWKNLRTQNDITAILTVQSTLQLYACICTEQHYHGFSWPNTKCYMTVGVLYKIVSFFFYD